MKIDELIQDGNREQLAYYEHIIDQTINEILIKLTLKNHIIKI